MSSHAFATGRLPRWNKIGGARVDQDLATRCGHQLLIRCCAHDSLIVARLSIGNLSTDPVAMAYEVALQWPPGRDWGHLRPVSTPPIIWNALVSRANSPLYADAPLNEAALRLLASGYLLKTPSVPGMPRQ